MVPLYAGPALELIDVVKTYPGVQALKGVSLRLTPGEVHTLVGENGAGKSSIVKILGGIERPDGGRLRLAGMDATLASPLAARRAGIAVIHQELSLLPEMTLAQNLLLGREELATRFGLLSPARCRRLAREMLGRLGLQHDPGTLAGALPVSEQQLVEIARALAEDATVILMDEPTAALTEAEAALLFAKIDELKRAGVAILYVSHRLDEVMRLADRITVLRDGAVVAHGPATAFTLEGIITAMVGRTIADHYPSRETRTFGPPLLEVDEPRAAECGGRVVIRAGEIVGLAGLVGSGRSEWAQALFAGEATCAIRLKGRPVTLRNPHESRALGLGLVPGERKTQGVLLDLSVRENLTITLLDRLSNALGFMRTAQITETARTLIGRLAIRCSGEDARVGTLSGGNQQKVAMAKWLARDCDVLILDEPTRGIDVGAKEEVYRLVLEVARAGKAVLLVSSEVPELLSLCDRIYVMRKGRFVAEIMAARTSQEQLIALAAGG
ncbi:MAG: sugar ABC transporter ATP-binding protein [Burkholderiales bacterium]